MHLVKVITNGKTNAEKVFEGFEDPFVEVSIAEECYLESIGEGMIALQLSGDVRRCLGMMRSDGHPTGFMRGKGSQESKDAKALAHYAMIEAGIDMNNIVKVETIEKEGEVEETETEAEVEIDGFGLIGVD